MKQHLINDPLVEAYNMVLNETSLNENKPINYDLQLERLRDIFKKDGPRMFYEFGAGADIREWIRTGNVPDWAEKIYPGWAKQDFEKLLQELSGMDQKSEDKYLHRHKI